MTAATVLSLEASCSPADKRFPDLLGQEPGPAIPEASALAPSPQVPPVTGVDDGRNLWLYRERTTKLLREYLRRSVAVGRLPSLLGREFFRSRISHRRHTTFENSVIFALDMERSLEKLNVLEQQLIACIVIQDYSQWQAARILRCGIRTVERVFPEALDHLSGSLLESGILHPLVSEFSIRENLVKSQKTGKTP